MRFLLSNSVITSHSSLVLFFLFRVLATCAKRFLVWSDIRAKYFKLIILTVLAEIPNIDFAADSALIFIKDFALQLFGARFTILVHTRSRQGICTVKGHTQFETVTAVAKSEWHFFIAVIATTRFTVLCLFILPINFCWL
jgi:hypothetical protein